VISTRRMRRATFVDELFDAVIVPSRGGRGGMADAADSKSVVRKDVEVQVLSPAPLIPRGSHLGLPPGERPVAQAFQSGTRRAAGPEGKIALNRQATARYAGV
jgi:hypothetical protein